MEIILYGWIEGKRKTTLKKKLISDVMKKENRN